MILQQETLFDIVQEVDYLLKMHYEEVAMHKEKIKLNPMWDEYASLERLGKFVVFTARQDGKLVGYAGFFLMTHMHYAETKLAINDVLFLHPDQRKSTCGYRLIKFADEQLAKRGDIDKITWHVKFSKDWSPVLHKLGYVDEEKVVGRIL